MDPFIGEIRLFAGSFAPVDWAICNGQLLQIQYYTDLFSVLGNMYGGDGKTTFALPDLRDRVPLHQGQGEGLTNRIIGEAGGSNSVLLTSDQMPAHNHLPACQTTPAQVDPAGQVWANTTGRGAPNIYAQSPNAAMNEAVVQPVGGGQAHNNVQPLTGIYYIIALKGVFPPR